MDLNGDGKSDVISGSWPGHVYLFRREVGGSFAGGERLTHQDGKPVNVGSGSSVFAFDWDGDGKLDLIIGTAAGDLFFLPNVGTREKPVFGESKPLKVDGKPIPIKHGDASPVVADWDGDGKPDLIVGSGDGSVVWYRNEGTRREPKLTPAQVLVPPSPSAWRSDKARKPDEWGVRVRPCVTDWNGDGKLDLLIGDLCGGCEATPTKTTAEADEEKDATAQLPVLRKEWAAAYREYAALVDAPEPADAKAREAHRRRVAALRTQVGRLKDEIARLQEIRDRYQSGYMQHGYIWLFLRKPTEK